MAPREWGHHAQLSAVADQTKMAGNFPAIFYDIGST
jgi:hypothetical protein